MDDATFSHRYSPNPGQEANFRSLSGDQITAHMRSVEDDPKAHALAAIEFHAMHEYVLWKDRLGSPYYKVFPGVMGLLLKTTLDIPFSMIRLPYPVFEIRLPDGEPLSVPGAHGVEQCFSLLVGKGEIEPGHNKSGLLFILQVCAQLEYGKTLSLTLLPDSDTETIEDYLETAKTEDNLLGNYDMSAWRLVIGVILMATGAVKDTLSRDVLRKDFRQYSESPEEEQDRISNRCDRRNHSTGHTLGRDIYIPRHMIDKHDEVVHRGHELSHSHWRCGHWRVQPYGRGMTMKRVIFIDSIKVRADLPASESQRRYSVDKVTKETENAPKQAHASELQRQKRNA